MHSNLFSENWYRVSKLKVSLLESVRVYSQVFKGEVWYLLEDIHNNKHYRVRENTYRFIKNLDHNKTIEENWVNYINEHPKISPNQEEVIQILTQLHTNNILFYKTKGQSQYIYDKSKDKKKKELLQKIQGFLFLKIPIFNPDKILDFFKPYANILFSLPSFLVWLGVVLFALNLIFTNHNEIFSQTQGILAPSNLILLYISIFVLKLFHELAHGIAAKKYGGNIYTFGLMFIIFTPLPYVDASNSWAFKNKWHRILVSSAGMYMELFLAAIAAIIWANTGEGLLHSIAFNIMVAGSVSSLLFNANPLLKFDAYFILSDYLEIPNLYQRSHAYTLSLMEKVFFGIDNVEEEKRKKESIQLVVYGILSYIYKLILTITIVIFVADQWFEIGVIVFIVSLYTMVLKPVYKFFIFIMSSEKLYKNRTRAKIVTAVLFTVFAYFFFLYESDDSVKANGTVNLKTQEQVYVTSEGILEEIYIANSQKVQKGDKLFKLSNKELDFTIEYTRYQLQESKQKRLKALNESLTHIKPIEEKIDFLTQKLEHLQEKKSDLIIKANTDGLIVFNPHIKEYLHSHLKLNSKVADILQHSNYEFISVIPQEEARELFEQNLTKSRLKLAGNIPNTFELTNVVILPHEKHTLPSLALSWQGGGNIETIQGDDGSFKTAESFFELRGDIVVQNGMKIPYQDQYGTIKIVLDKITLYERTIRYISQVLQKRYRL
jgi:putative peptide zinc metalloprotease protein